MYIPLQTHDIWEIDGDFSPPQLIENLSSILEVDDIIAFGAYEPNGDIFGDIPSSTTDAGKIYFTSFDLNRTEHPNGRSHEIAYSDIYRGRLKQLAELSNGQIDKQLFFDHLLAYRHGLPVLPLFCFHDAFYGGQLTLSGLYTEETIKQFSSSLDASFNKVSNPEFRIDDV